MDNEWIVHNKGKVADCIIHSSLTHIASKRYFIPAFDHMRGLAPPPGFSEIVKTSIGTGKVQLTVKILQKTTSFWSRKRGGSASALPSATIQSSAIRPAPL